jgi:hypothetical protein
MNREKRLSPRRAPRRSHLPHSPRPTQVRLKPLLFLRPLPLQRRHTKKARLARFCTQYEHPLFDARPEGFRSSVRLRRMSSRPTARLRRKSTVCGLNRFLPSAEADGALHLNPRPPVRGSCSYASLRRAQTSTAFPFWKQKLRLKLIFLSKTESKRFLERRERKKAMAQSARADDGHSTKQQTLITYYNEHQSHHHQW